MVDGLDNRGSNRDGEEAADVVPAFCNTSNQMHDETTLNQQVAQ